MSISYNKPILEEHIFRVVRQAISKRNEMHRKLDVKTHCQGRMRWGGWFAILKKAFKEGSQNKDWQESGGAHLDRWEKSLLRRRESGLRCRAGCVASMLGGSREASVARVKCVRVERWGEGRGV